MCSRIFTIVVIAIALILAIAATVMPPEKLASIIYISRFFDVMLPILAVGALIKYIACGGGHHCGKCDKTKVDVR